ncbi:MAG: hypothetical protein AAFY72_17750 [Cyanobacteria bacterium J06649_4]
MKLSRAVLSAFLGLLTVGLAKPVIADTGNAHCEYRPYDGSTVVRMPCTVSQRQGWVTIAWEDGVYSQFNPVNRDTGLYVDERGGTVHRRSHPDLGEWVFEMERGVVSILSWD